jgi:hypothetical protein
MGDVKSKEWIANVRKGGVECIMEDGSVLTDLCDAYEFLRGVLLASVRHNVDGRRYLLRTIEGLTAQLGEAWALLSSERAGDGVAVFKQNCERNVSAFCALHILSQQTKLSQGTVEMQHLAELIQALVDGDHAANGRITKMVIG